MDLKTALGMVVVDTREQDGDPNLSDTEAVKLARSCGHGDVNGAVDAPELREAYHLVIDASDTEIASVLS